MEKLTRVLVLAPVHRNWGNRVVREAEILAQEGYSVTALMQCEQPETRNGVSYDCAPPAKGRLTRFLKLPIVLCFAIRFRADIYHLHNPDMIPLAFFLRLLGKRIVYDTHEDYSRRLSARAWIPLYIRKPLGLFVSAAERLLSYVIDATFVTQDNQLAHFSKRTYLLRNAPFIPHRVKKEVEALSFGITKKADTYYLVYAGGISKERGIFTMIEALQALNEDNVPTRLWLIGPEIAPCIDEAKKLPGWSFVDYLGLQSQEVAFAHMVKADVGLAVLSDVGDHSSARPSKLFEYMAWGLPFVSSHFDSWHSFVNGKGGLWIQPDHTNILKDALELLLLDQTQRTILGDQGKNFIDGFNWDKESKVLIDKYRCIR